jgi:putative membrane protein
MFQAAFAVWQVPLWTSGWILLSMALYMRGFALVRPQMPARFSRWRLASYLAGNAALAIALVSPLEALDEQLLIAHMMQHLILLMIAPPLLLLGTPQIPLIRAIPPVLAKRTIGVIAKSQTCRRLFNLMTHPVSAFLLFSIAMLGWHLPGSFEFALSSDYWHAVEHGCFIVGGLLFWYPIVRPWPAVERWSRLTLVPYLMLADIENTMLAAFMVFSGRLLYPSYASTPRIGGISAATDQIAAGSIMWVPGSIVFLIPAVAIVISVLKPHTLIRPPKAIATQAI